MDEATFQQLLQATPQAAQQTPQASVPVSAPEGSPIPSTAEQPHPDAIGEPSNFMDAIVGGIANAGFQTKDFLFGDPDKKSAVRSAIEQGTEAADRGSIVNSALTSISQFATGMLGAGKLAALSRLPEVAEAAGGIAKTALEAGKAASVGAIAFDPHQERLSNLVQQAPILSNPVTAWLAAKPEDSEAEGRMKAALESIGLDATLAGAFMAAGKLYRAIKSGDHAALPQAADELEAAQAKATQAEATQSPAEAPTAPETAEAPVEGAPAEGPQGAPEAPPEAVPAGEVPQAADGGPAMSFREVEQQPAELAQPGMEAQRPVMEEAQPPADSLWWAADADDGGLGTEPNAKFKPSVTISEGDAESLIQSTRADLAAIDDAGSVQGAVDAGHTFGKGAGVPWNKLNLPGEVDDFVARVADTIKGQLDAAKGGAILSDARVAKQVQGIANYFNMDPTTIAGSIQQAGNAASKMVSQMEAAYLISNKMFQEAFALANRVGLGDLSGYASRDAAVAEFQRQASLAGSMFASGQSMRAAFGRGLRRQRMEFAVDPQMVERIKAVGGDRLMELFKSTLGDPNKLKKVTNPSFLQKAASDMGFLIQNNLLWGMGTHFVNAMSNGYMVGIRPFQRAIGFAAMGDAQHALENMRQYGYIVPSMVDSFSAAWQALKTADSVLNPHHVYMQETSNAVGPIQRIGTTLDWKPFDSLYNVGWNTMAAGIRTATFPARTMAAADEFMKNLTYRSKVQAGAYTDGAAQGLAGQDLRDFIAQKLDAAFDDSGRATDNAALLEAQRSTFTQDLQQGTIGKWLQGGVAQHPIMRLILPFTQTPVNIFRQAVKDLPGAGMVQSEFRDMLFGRMGAEQQAQAIGQLAWGSSLLMAIAGLGLNVTGGGPSDPKVRQEMMDTGWRPYSYVWQSDDGTKHFFPIGRIDPLGMPFGIVADIMDYLHQPGSDASKVQGAISTLGYSLVKQVSEKTYLRGIAGLVDAFSDPKENLSKFVGKTLTEVLPFSSAFRNYSSDPYMRDARSAVDQLMAATPGLGSTLPPKYDALGEPVTARNTFMSTSPDNRVDRELQRMGDLGYTIIPPTPTMHNADLRDITTADGKDAWAWYQQLAGKPTTNSQTLRARVDKVMATPAYEKAPDGPADVAGTKLWMLHDPVIAYRRAAEFEIQKDQNVRQALYAAQQKVAGAYADRRAGITERNSNLDQLKNIVGSFTQGLGMSLNPPQQ